MTTYVSKKHQEWYKSFLSKRENKRPIFLNCARAFFSGGVICFLAQLLEYFLKLFFKIHEQEAISTTIAIVILISVILTGIGIYDHIAQWAGAGTSIPITGFANTITSASIEHRTEGLVLGVGSNMFKLAGSVIAFGVTSSFIVVLIKLILSYIVGG